MLKSPEDLGSFPVNLVGGS